MITLPHKLRISRLDWAVLAMGGFIGFATLSLLAGGDLAASLVGGLMLGFVWMGVYAAVLGMMRMTNLVSHCRRHPYVFGSPMALCAVMFHWDAAAEEGWFGFVIALWFSSQFALLFAYESYCQSFESLAEPDRTSV